MSCVCVCVLVCECVCLLRGKECVLVFFRGGAGPSAGTAGSV